MFRIKICGITNREDAAAACAAGADAVGFNFFGRSRRYIEPAAARAAGTNLPAHVLKVGVFVNHDAVEIETAADLARLDAVQLHGDEPAELLARLSPARLIVRAFRYGTSGMAPLCEYLRECHVAGRLPDAVLVDADAGPAFGGTGQRVDWSRLAIERGMLSGVPLILAGGLTPANVGAAVAAVRPDGVDVASGVERAAGRKDNRLVADFVAAAKRAFGNTI